MLFYLPTTFTILFDLIPFLSILCSCTLFMPSYILSHGCIDSGIISTLLLLSVSLCNQPCQDILYIYTEYLILLSVMKLTWRTWSVFVSLSQNYFIFLCNFPKNNAVDFLPVQYCCCWRWWLSTVFVRHILSSWHPICVAIWQSCCGCSTLVVVNLC